MVNSDSRSLLLTVHYLPQIKSNNDLGPDVVNTTFLCDVCVPHWQAKRFKANQNALAKKEGFFKELIQEINSLL